MSEVIFQHAEYDHPKLKEKLFEMLDALDGGRIRKNMHILIKPNLLAPAKPESGIQTHPLVTRIVAEYVLDKGTRPQISDSPAMGSFEYVLKVGEYRKICNGLNADFSPFKTSMKKDIGIPFGEIDIASDALKADMVINLAKLKTHSQMLLTLGVKNLFGCVVGIRKPEWHMRCGVSRETFATLLVQICQAVQPAITLVDGILALEGEGPGKSGTPRHLGVLAGGRHAPSVDQAVCSMLHVHPDRLPTHLAAKRLGFINSPVDMVGAVPRIDDFQFPVLGSLAFGPRIFQNAIRKHMIQRPIADPKVCRLCGKCWEFCPAKAITSDQSQVNFDYDRCIRCYCCIEICPYGAIHTKETIPGRLLRQLQQAWENRHRP